MEIRRAQVQNRPTMERTLQSVPESLAPPATTQDLGPVDVFQSLPSTYQDPDTRPVVFPTSAPPALERPVLFLHGFNGSADSFDPLHEWLTSGANPSNKSGGKIRPDSLGNLDPKANLFSLNLSRPYNSIETNSAELKKTVEAICKATGSKEIDLVVHSLGGLNARDYLREPDEKVKRFVMLGTPNHGSQLANLELVFREKFGYPIAPPVDDPEVREVLKQLSVDKNNRNGTPKNPYLRELNNGWEEQRKHADILLVAGAGIPTLTGTPGVTAFGDGVVTRASAKLDGIESKTSWFTTHGRIPKSAKVMENTANFLLTGKSLTTDENLYDSPEDEIRAKELMSSKPGNVGAIGGASIEQVQKASQLPLLDPAFQFGLGLGVLAAMMGGPKATLPLVEIELASKQAGDDLKASYNIDLQRSQDPVQGRGSLNGSTFGEKANLVDGKLHWQSDSRGTGSGLTLEVGDDEASIFLNGQLSGVNASLRIAPFADATGHIAGIETTGMLNGQPYNVKSTVDVEALLFNSANNHGEMQVTGTVNGQTIEKSYEVGTHRDQLGLQLIAYGAGTNLGQDQSVSVNVRVSDR